jgi:pimeloyl-ACP methyl ester carboxylesterase
MQSGYAPVNGLQMYYEVHGAGRPLVMLHGGLHTADLTFHAFAPVLAATRQVILAEVQGHGHTADTDRELTIPNLASDVVGLLDHLGIAQVDLFGFSLGGLTAMQTALTSPERVGKLVVSSIQFRAGGFHEEIRNPELHATSRRMPTAADFQEMREAYERVAPDPGHFEAFAEKVSAAANGFPGWSDDALRGLAVPTLVMLGDTDFVPVEHAAEMFSLIPDAQLAVLPATTHVDVPRRPDLVMPAVEAFLK